LKLLVGAICHTFHGEGFAGSGLSIGENGSVVSFQYAFDDRKSSLFKDGGLLASWGKDCIISEISCGREIALLWVGIIHSDPSVVLIDVDDEFMVGLGLFSRGGSASDHDLHCLGLGTYGFGWHNSNLLVISIISNHLNPI
jgi:hypothetical protein